MIATAFLTFLCLSKAVLSIFQKIVCSYDQNATLTSHFLFVQTSSGFRWFFGEKGPLLFAIFVN